jgi:hypothetical protein
MQICLIALVEVAIFKYGNKFVLGILLLIKVSHQHYFKRTNELSNMVHTTLAPRYYTNATQNMKGTK